jgi:hypothetical protein
MKRITILAIALVLVLCEITNAQKSNIIKETFTYAKRDGYELRLDRYIDDSVKAEGSKWLIIYVPGGGWEGGSRDDKSLIPFYHHFASLGYNVVAIDYRLGIKMAKEKGEFNSGNSVEKYIEAINMGVEELYDATAFILKRADEWNIDKDQIIIMGGSAGATNCNMAEYGICNRTSLAEKYLPSDFNYAGVVSMAGAFWFQDPDTALVWKNKPCPWMFFHGAKDQLVTYNEIHEGFGGYGPAYVSKLFDTMEVPYWFYDYPDGDHLISGSPMIDSKPEIEIFLAKFLKENQELFIHTIERGTINKDFSNFRKLYEDYYKSVGIL